MLLFFILIVNTALGFVSKSQHLASQSFQLEKIRKSANSSIANSTKLVNYDDFYYAINIQIGTPAQNLQLLVDTGSSILWVANLTCHNCSIKRRYDPDISSSYQNLQKDHFQQYGQGQCSGVFGNERFDLTDTPIDTELEFLLVNNESDINLALATSGLMGLSNWNEYENIFEASYKQHQITSSLFGFAFFDESQTSELFYGNWNQSVIDQTIWMKTNMEKTWSLKTLSVEINNDEFYYFPDHSSIFDSGTSCLLLQADFYQYFSLKYLNCNEDCICNQQYPTLTFYFEGIRVSVPDTAYKFPVGNGSCWMCIGSTDQFNVLGDPFMRQIISIFDKQNQQIGVYQQEQLKQISIWLIAVSMLIIQTLFFGLIIWFCIERKRLNQEE